MGSMISALEVSGTVAGAVALGLLGLTFGSFVNAAVWRIRQGRAMSLLNERSECPRCGQTLAWYDLVPVVSWLALRGRCRYCRAPIEDTPLPEVGVAVYFVVSFLFWPEGLTGALGVTDFIFWLAYGVLLAILFVYDRRYMLLPDKLTFTLVGLAAVNLLVHVLAAPANAVGLLADAVLGVASIAGVYLVLYVVSRGRWVGYGDVKLSLFIGLALADWRLGLLTFLLANLIGSLVILPGLLTHRLTRTSRVPFGPFLIVGFVMAKLFGSAIVGWYLATLYLG